MMTTNLIVTGVMLGIFITMVVVNYFQMKKLRKRSWENFLEIKSQLNKHHKYLSDIYVGIVRDLAEFEKDLNAQSLRVEESTEKQNKLIEEFIELCDDDYKKQIKQLEVNERFATKQLTEYYMAVRSLDDNYKKKIQFRLDKMLNKKNGKEKKIPITNNKEGEKE